MLESSHITFVLVVELVVAFAGFWEYDWVPCIYREVIMGWGMSSSKKASRHCSSKNYSHTRP